MRRLRRLRTRWNQLVCAYRHGMYHGTVYRERNRLSVFCRTCGYESAGVDLETSRVRMAWMWERHRLRWRTHRTAC